MKKIIVFSAVVSLSVLLSFCSSSKRAAGKAPETPKSTYSGSLSTLITANCSPCHIPEKGGNKKPFDNYANVKSDIDEIIRRIELEPTVKGFMPFRKSEKLPTDVIMAFKKWKEDGMPEN